MTISILCGVLVFAAIGWLRDWERAGNYRDLWCAEEKRHAAARLELSQWIETSRVSGDACAAHKSTIAKLKMEVTRLHEENDALREAGTHKTERIKIL